MWDILIRVTSYNNGTKFHNREILSPNFFLYIYTIFKFSFPLKGSQVQGEAVARTQIHLFETPLGQVEFLPIHSLNKKIHAYTFFQHRKKQKATLYVLPNFNNMKINK